MVEHDSAIRSLEVDRRGDVAFSVAEDGKNSYPFSVPLFVKSFLSSFRILAGRLTRAAVCCRKREWWNMMLRWKWIDEGTSPFLVQKMVRIPGFISVFVASSLCPCTYKIPHLAAR